MARRTVEDQLRKFYAKGDYNGPSNYVRGDGMFYSSIIKEFGQKEVDRVKDRISNE